MVTACFKEKNTLAKCLIFLVSVLIMILVAVTIILTSQKQDKQVCKSEQCINLSAQVIRYAERSKDPCEDFHVFACGRRELSPPSPEEEIKAMIQQMVQTGDSKPFIMQKSFYLSCSNLNAIEMDNDETIMDMFYSLGDWPVLRGAHWDSTYFEWEEVSKKARKIGLKFDWFLEFSVYEDRNDTGLNILKINIPNVSTLKPSEILPREKLFTKIAITLGAPERLAHYETGRTIDFENALGALAEEHRNRSVYRPTYPKITIQELQELWPNIRWLELINNITGQRWMGSDRVIFDGVIDYVKDLTKLIYGTPKRIVADYMMWKIVEEIWPYLSQEVRDKFEDSQHVQYQQSPELLDRLEFCTNESRKQFPLVAESEYIRRHVTQQKRELVKEMLVLIQNKFINLVRRSSSLNKAIKYRALTRLQNLDFLVGAPRHVFDQFGFAEDLGLYGFVFRSTNVIEMLAERKLRFYDNYFRRLNKFVSNATQAYYQKVVKINSFAVINENTLVIPATVLRNVFYNPKLPNYFNYASLGTTLAKAIFEHIFERNNRTIIDPFDAVLKCLIKESSNLLNQEPKRLKIMRESLADFIAPEVAYEAYKEWSLLHPQEFKLPGLEFSPRQLFWIHASKLSCNKIYTKSDRNFSRFKVIGPLRNSPNFGADYNCTQFSRMYSQRQCKIL